MQLVKDLASSLQQLRSLLWCRFDPLAGELLHAGVGVGGGVGEGEPPKKKKRQTER